MASSGENSFKSQWRESLLSQLHNRNKQEFIFEDLINHRKYLLRYEICYLCIKKVNITSKILNLNFH